MEELVRSSDTVLLRAPTSDDAHCVFARIERVGLEDVIRVIPTRPMLHLLVPLAKPDPATIWLTAFPPVSYGNVALYTPGCLASSIPECFRPLKGYKQLAMVAEELNQGLVAGDIGLKQYASLLRRLFEKRIDVYHYVPVDDDRVSVTPLQGNTYKVPRKR